MKLTLHCQSIPSWAAQYLEFSGAKYIKTIGSYPTFPGVTTIGRIVHSATEEPEPLNTLIRNGAAGADELFYHVWPIIGANPQVGFWELYNEPSIWDASVLTGFESFNLRLIWRMHSLDKKIVVGAINTGHPRLPNEDGGKMMDRIAAACYGADALSLHEYEPRAMDQSPGANCLRYRYLVDYFIRKGYYLPPIFITECGLDLVEPGGPNFGHYGWKSILKGDELEYARQLLWYESMLQADSAVKCATIFTAGPQGWDDFEVTESLAMKIASGNKPPNGGNVKYFNRDGSPMTEEEFRKIFGNGVIIEQPEGSIYKVTELYDSGENAGMDCQVFLRDGYTDGMRAVVVNGGEFEAAIKAPTMQEVGFYKCYADPFTGPYRVFIKGGEGPSDIVHGLGWICSTNHRHVQHIVYEKQQQQEQPPVPKYSYKVDGLTVWLDASESYDPDGSIVRYIWNLGDGNKKWGKVKSHTYENSGTYAVRLIVVDNEGLRKGLTKNITVSESNEDKAIALLEEAQLLIDEAQELIRNSQ